MPNTRFEFGVDIYCRYGFSWCLMDMITDTLLVLILFSICRTCQSQEGFEHKTWKPFWCRMLFLSISKPQSLWPPSDSVYLLSFLISHQMWSCLKGLRFFAYTQWCQIFQRVFEYSQTHRSISKKGKKEYCSEQKHSWFSCGPTLWRSFPKAVKLVTVLGASGHRTVSIMREIL